MELITHQEAVKMLLRVTTREEWNSFVDIIKIAHGGKYPEWWYPKIIASGFADQIMAEWGGSTKITVSYENH